MLQARVLVLAEQVRAMLRPPVLTFAAASVTRR